jgi:hypothetical protein
MNRVALAVLCLALWPTRAAGAPSAGIACYERRPEPDSVRALRFTAHDESGERTILLLRLHGRRSPEQLGQLFVRVERPEELRGTSLLMLQRPEDESVKHGEIWVPHFATMRDRVNHTTTTLMVDSHEQEALLGDGQFSVEGLERAVRGDARPSP